MDNKSNLSKRILGLRETSEKLNVSIEVLIEWNEYNILKPVITPEGTIGYTEEQLGQFIAIQSLIQVNQTLKQNADLDLPVALESSEDKNIESAQNGLSWNFKKAEEQSFKEKIDSPSNISSNTYISSKLFSLPLLSVGLASFVFFSILTFAVIFSVGEQKSASNITPDETSTKVLGSQTSNLKFAGITSITSPIDQTKETDLNNQINSEGEKVLSERINVKDVLFTKAPVDTTSKNSQDISWITSQLGKFSSAFSKTGSGLKGDVGDDSSITTYASRSTNQDPENNLIFDEGGKIKGEAADTLSSTLGALGVLTSSVPKQINSGPMSGVTMIAIGLVTLFYMYPRAFAYNGKISQKKQYTPSYRVDTLQKIIEVDQKTDGTIFLVFDGKEYKISKPELHSESDQFIERLMMLVKPGMKELEYVGSNDEDIDTKTPLSRLVTRLGFVGLKREIFFPRTSKNRVLFRKYITAQDLTDMNLTTEQILADLS